MNRSTSECTSGTILVKFFKQSLANGSLGGMKEILSIHSRSYS